MADAKQVKSLSMSDLMDGTLDDLADKPEFKPYPPGAHKVLVKIEFKDQVGKDKALGVIVKFKALETMQLPEGSKDSPLEKGAETQIMCMMNNEFGQGVFKDIMAAGRAKFFPGQEVPNGAVIKKINEGAEAIIITDTRQNKDTKQWNTQLMEITFDF